MDEYVKELTDKTYISLLPIVNGLNTLLCPNCGGTYIGSSCKYCHSKNETLEEDIEKLTNILRRYKDCLANVPKEEIKPNKLFALLNSIKNIKINYIDELLQDYGYDELQDKQLLDKVYERTIERMSKNELLLEEDIPFIEIIIQENKKDLNFFMDYFIKYLIVFPQSKYSNIPMISYESFKVLIKFWIEKQIANYFSNPSCKIVEESVLNPDDDDELDITNGDCYMSSIRLSEEMVKNLYMDGSNALIEIIFHEIKHTYQYAFVFSGKEISYVNFIMTMDNILSKLLPGYYDENYNRISYEIDAKYFGKLSQLKLLNIFFSINNEEREMQFLEECRIEFFNLTRTFNGEEIQLCELFKKVVSDKLSLLAKYPQLNVLFKKVDDKVVLKDYVEIQGDSTLTDNQKEELSLFFPATRGVSL